MVGAWNDLPEEAVEAGTNVKFKRHLAKNMDEKLLDGYGANVWDHVGQHE